MRKTTYILIVRILLSLIVIVGICSCSNASEPNKDEHTTNNVSTFIMDLSIKDYPDKVVTRTDSEWVEGDSIFLLFESEKGLAYGIAVYNDQAWSVDYDGKLNENKASKCKTFFFQNKVSYAHSKISLNAQSIIYEDSIGEYNLKDGCLSVKATLKPKTGRIRFKGENHLDIKFSGISFYTSFNRFTGEFQKSNSQLSSKVDGEYTPYYYGYFTDPDERPIKIWSEEGNFVRYFPENSLAPGISGYVTIPTKEEHNGWLFLFE